MSQELRCDIRSEIVPTLSPKAGLLRYSTEACPTCETSLTPNGHYGDGAGAGGGANLGWSETDMRRVKLIK